jgi:hypothetical protein
MICEQLSNTGGHMPLPVLVLAAIALILVGGAITLAARRRHMAPAIALVLILGVTASVTIPAGPARATTSQCDGDYASVQVFQTSVMDGLAPGIAPVAIHGIVVNSGSSTIRVIAVDVRISSITVELDSHTGSCDATDYRLVDEHMPVSRTLFTGRSATFAGASIGFSDKPTAQDACQNATVHLLYTVRATGH